MKLPLGIFLFLAVFFEGQPALAASVTPHLEQLRSLRKSAAWRQRRLLFNDDGLAPLPYRTADELIALRVKQVKNTQVDSIFYCTGGGGLFWGHQPEVGEILGQFVAKDDTSYVAGVRDGLLTLKALGTDPLAAVIGYGHENHMEVFWSYRMNNPEDSFASWALSERKRQHPEYLMGKKTDWNSARLTDPKVWWALEDYARPEVREYIVQIFEDVCQRYDVDGVEMDFLRHPLFFRPNLEGLPATAEQVGLMTEMVRRIREMTERIGLQKGRPILVSIHTPLSVQSCRAIGIDLPAFLKEGLVDILVAGQDYAQMGVAAELKTTVDLGHQAGVPVYSFIAPPNPHKMENGIRAWRGAAMNRWYWGADGLYTFNLFPQAPDAKFNELGSPESLRGLDKIYGMDNPTAESVLGTFKLSGAAPDALPISLEAGKVATARLAVGEDISANAPAGKTAFARLRFQIPALGPDQQVVVRFNERDLGLPVKQGTHYEINVDPNAVVAGFNSIDFTLSGGSTASLEALDLVISYQ